MARPATMNPAVVPLYTPRGETRAPGGVLSRSDWADSPSSLGLYEGGDAPLAPRVAKAARATAQGYIGQRPLLPRQSD